MTTLSVHPSGTTGGNLSAGTGEGDPIASYPPIRKSRSARI